jgi:plasmid maintenance system killer protein
MEIFFQDRKLGKIANNQSQLIRNYGQQQAKLLRRRLDDLIVADTLEDIRFLP